jgi:hypothetical protein
MPPTKNRDAAPSRPRAVASPTGVSELIPKRGPVHARMLDFLGRWQTVGRTGPGAPVPNVDVTGYEIYDWAPGRFFVTHQFDRRIGEDEHKGIGVLGYDAATQRYFANVFDNHGYARQYDVQVKDRVWTFAGQRERATFVLSDDGASMSIEWTVSSDGARWRPLCELKATKY